MDHEVTLLPSDVIHWVLVTHCANSFHAFDPGKADALGHQSAALKHEHLLAVYALTATTVFNLHFDDRHRTYAFWLDVVQDRHADSESEHSHPILDYSPQGLVAFLYAAALDDTLWRLDEGTKQRGHLVESKLYDTSVVWKQIMDNPGRYNVVDTFETRQVLEAFAVGAEQSYYHKAISQASTFSWHTVELRTAILNLFHCTLLRGDDVLRSTQCVRTHVCAPFERKKNYWPALKHIIDAWHTRQTKVTDRTCLLADITDRVQSVGSWQDILAAECAVLQWLQFDRHNFHLFQLFTVVGCADVQLQELYTLLHNTTVDHILQIYDFGDNSFAWAQLQLQKLYEFVRTAPSREEFVEAAQCVVLRSRSIVKHTLSKYAVPVSDVKQICTELRLDETKSAVPNYRVHLFSESRQPTPGSSASMSIFDVRQHNNDATCLIFEQDAEGQSVPLILHNEKLQELREKLGISEEVSLYASLFDEHLDELYISDKLVGCAAQLLCCGDQTVALLRGSTTKFDSVKFLAGIDYAKELIEGTFKLSQDSRILPQKVKELLQSIGFDNTVINTLEIDRLTVRVEFTNWWLQHGRSLLLFQDTETLESGRSMRLGSVGFANDKCLRADTFFQTTQLQNQLSQLTRAQPETSHGVHFVHLRERQAYVCSTVTESAQTSRELPNHNIIERQRMVCQDALSSSTPVVARSVATVLDWSQVHDAALLSDLICNVLQHGTRRDDVVRVCDFMHRIVDTSADGHVLMQLAQHGQSAPFLQQWATLRTAFEKDELSNDAKYCGRRGAQILFFLTGDLWHTDDFCALINKTTHESRQKLYTQTKDVQSKRINFDVVRHSHSESFRQVMDSFRTST